MKGKLVPTTVCAGVLALSLLLPLTTPTFAQTTNPTAETQRMETRDNGDNTGLWGLLGLAGLIGLAGRRQRSGKVGVYDAR
jgi:MYXO-CTERM domain-containing protein